MSPMKQRSQGVFIVAVLFLAILVAQVFLYGNFFRDLKTDTGVINDLSRIRGSIQRYTKLEIAGVSGDSAILTEYIDGLIARNMENDTEATRESISQLYDMKMLNMK